VSPDGPAVAVDAMGGDKAPGEIVAGARRAADAGIPVILVGPPDQVGDTQGLELFACEQVIAMDEEPGSAVRRKKDSSLVRAAELVRDGKASAMVSAGNTGATMASALLRMGRLRGVGRPAIATPLPRPGRPPAFLVDAGANADCTPAMLVQFARMGSAYSAARCGIERPTVGLLSIGEEPTKGNSLAKEAHSLLTAEEGLVFSGNVEGRDLLAGPVDVVVTDGFTGNVALKALEGSLRFLVGALLDVFGRNEETRAASEALMPYLLPLFGEINPDGTGGAMLLGVKGVCVISHGSSSALAIDNAVRIAYELHQRGLVDELADAVAAP
jgi:phosphate acyltransferase